MSRRLVQYVGDREIETSVVVGVSIVIIRNAAFVRIGRSAMDISPIWGQFNNSPALESRELH